MIYTCNHLPCVITQNQETVAMTSMAVSKQVFKSQTAPKWRSTNVQCNVCFLLILCIYRYIFLLNTLSSGKSCLVAPRVAVPKWRSTNVQCNVCFLLILCIYRYIFLLNTLSSGKSCLVAPRVAVPPWATETVLSPWLAVDEVRVSHVLSHVVWWKKKKEKKKKKRKKKVKWSIPRKVVVLSHTPQCRLLLGHPWLHLPTFLLSYFAFVVYLLVFPCVWILSVDKNVGI